MFGQDKSEESRNVKVNRYIGDTPIATETPKKISETEQVIIKLQNSVSVLGDMVASIEDKLAPIIRQSNVKDDEAVEPEFGTKIAQEINKAVRNINYLSEKVRDLRERVEL